MQSVLEEFSGGRLHYMANQVGGLKVDLPEGWPDRVRETIAAVRLDLVAVASSTVLDDDFRARARGVGRLDPALVPAYGLSGPVARASGDDRDLRRDEPYLAYGALADLGALRVVTRDEGDALARYEVLVEQCAVSLDLADACLDALAGLPDGPVNLRLPKVLRVPEGETYTWTENPLGINGYYLVSRGEKTPWRLKLQVGVVQQRAGARGDAAGRPPRRPRADPAVDGLRAGRRRQVTPRTVRRGGTPAPRPSGGRPAGSSRRRRPTATRAARPSSS